MEQGWLRAGSHAAGAAERLRESTTKAADWASVRFTRWAHPEFGDGLSPLPAGILFCHVLKGPHYFPCFFSPSSSCSEMALQYLSTLMCLSSLCLALQSLFLA